MVWPPFVFFRDTRKFYTDQRKLKILIPVENISESKLPERKKKRQL